MRNSSDRFPGHGHVGKVANIHRLAHLAARDPFLPESPDRLRGAVPRVPQAQAVPRRTNWSWNCWSSPDGLVEEVLLCAGRLLEASVEVAGGTPALEALHPGLADAVAERRSPGVIALGRR